MAFRTAPLSSGRIVPRVTIRIVMVISKEKCFLWSPHFNLWSYHNWAHCSMIGYIDIIEDIVAFVLAKITSRAKRVKYFV